MPFDRGHDRDCGAWSALVGCVLMMAGGCTNAAVVRFSNEYRCPQNAVQVEDLGAASYRVTGCGRSATYVCRSVQYQGAICVLNVEGQHTQTSAAPPTAREDVGRPLARPPVSRGFVDIQGTRVPAIQLELSGMPATIARDPSSAGTISFHLRLSYPGQAQHCATLQLTDSQHPAM